LRGVDDDFNAQIDAQRGLTYEEWEAWQTKEAQLGTFFKWGGMQHFNFIDRFAEFALHLDVHKPQGIWTEYPEYFDPELPLHTNLQRDPVSEYDLDIIEAAGTALILTEGHSDTKILSAAIKAMYPEFADMYQFVDFRRIQDRGRSITADKDGPGIRRSAHVSADNRPFRQRRCGHGTKGRS
ncbi:hypothetical protein, partial [Sinorhizobium meliloti]